MKKEPKWLNLESTLERVQETLDREVTATTSDAEIEKLVANLEDEALAGGKTF